MNARHLLLAASFLLLAAVACGSQPGRSPAGASRSAGSAGQAGQPAVDRGQSSSTIATAPPGPAPLAEGKRVQRSAQLTVQVANGRFDSSLDRLMALIQEQNGYVSGSEAVAEPGDRVRSGQVTFQVPVANFNTTISGLRRIGTAESVRIAGNDVSTQYVDYQARLRNAEAQRNAMLALLEQAKSVNDMLQIQNQLGQITAQIEQLKGQIDYLDHTTAYATVAVTLREAAAGVGADEWGFRTALQQALHASVNAINLAVVVLGAAAPFLLLGGIVGLVAWRVRRRRRPPTVTAQT